MSQKAQMNRSHAVDSSVGFVGVGRMGHPLALNALKAGFRVGVYDIDAAAVDRLALRGAKGMLSLREMGEWADVVEIAVFNDAQLEEVLIGKGGILETARPGAVIAVHSTVEIETVIRLGEAAAAKQVGFLDVSMSGGMDGAEAARLCFMVGGEERPFELSRPVLEASAKAIVHLGPLGSGITAKVIQNAIYGMTKQGAYEGLSLATAAGLDLAKFGEALHYSTGQSYAADGVFKRAGNRDAANEAWGGPGMHSVEMALDLARRYGLELPALKNAHAFLKRDHSATERMPHGVSSRPNS